MVQDPQSASGLPSSVSNPRVVRGDDGRYYAVVYTDKTGVYGDLLPENYHLAHSQRHTHRAGKHLHGRHHHGRATQPSQAYAPAQVNHRRSSSHPRINPWSGESISTNDGFADNPLAQALFHSRVAQGTWTTSYKLVRDVAIVYEALAFAPILAYLSAPAIEAAVSAASEGWFGPALNRFFWSGREVIEELSTNTLMKLMSSGLVVSGLRAAELAEEEGGMSLEMTPFGQMLTQYGVQTDNAVGSFLWNLHPRCLPVERSEL